jgi:hypothetical protein
MAKSGFEPIVTFRLISDKIETRLRERLHSDSTKQLAVFEASPYV